VFTICLNPHAVVVTKESETSEQSWETKFVLSNVHVLCSFVFTKAKNKAKNLLE
jgi:hypothetical protein